MTAVFTVNGTADVSAETCPCGPCKARRDSTAAKLAALLRVDKLRENGWKVELPDGQWAIVRDPTTVTNGQRRTFKEAGVQLEMLGTQVNRAMGTGNGHLVDSIMARIASLGAGMDSHIVAMFLATWSYDAPVPLHNDSGSLDAIPGLAMDRLSMVAKDLMHAAFLDDEPSSNEDSPFGGSSDSNTPS